LLIILHDVEATCLTSGCGIQKQMCSLLGVNLQKYVNMRANLYGG
jgi:hypothetical protein